MTLNQLIYAIKSDLRTYGGRSFFRSIGVYMFSPPFRLMLNYRIGKYFYDHKLKLLKPVARYYKYRQLTKRNCQLSFRSEIGLNVKLPHPLGIVIGEGVIIEDNVSIWQQVTLGSHGREGQIVTYPVVKSGAKLFAGAKIIGGVTIGENAKVGANAVVNINVPDNSVAIGIPAKIVIK